MSPWKTRQRLLFARASTRPAGVSKPGEPFRDLGDSAHADVDSSGRAAIASGQRSDVRTPLLQHPYICSNAGILTCYELASGREIYRERVGGTSYTASPVAADGRIYLASEQGELRVVKAGAQFELLAVNEMGDVCMATPAISAGALFVRSQHFLHALGRKPGPGD